MNAHDSFMNADLAVLHYGDGEYAVLKPGKYVLCAVTGQMIPLEALRYWSPIVQEAYAGPAEALARWRELNAPSAPEA
jgi:hypothetical protein